MKLSITLDIFLGFDSITLVIFKLILAALSVKLS